MRRLLALFAFFPLFAQAQQLDLSRYHLTPLTSENLEDGILQHFQERAVVRSKIASHVSRGLLPKAEIEKFAPVPNIETLEVRDLKISLEQTTNRLASFFSFVEVPMILASSTMEIGIEGKPVQTFKCEIDLLPGSESATFNDCQSQTEMLESFSVSFSDVKVERSM